MEGCGKVLNVKNGIAVGLRDGVKCLIVSTRVPVSRCLLGDHVQRWGPGTQRRLNNSQFQHTVEFLMGNM